MELLFLLPLVAFLFTSCASQTPAGRIEKNPALYNDLNTSEQALVRAGRIENGMTPNAVYLAWGKADSRSEGEHEGKRFERWNYIGLAPVYNQSYYSGFGYGYHDYYGRRGRGRSYTPYYGNALQVDYVPYRAAWVDFQNGRVKNWQRGR
ncbi:MAG: hypothetical protein QNL33_04055 [Akkermansiaceae bacterium]